MQKNTYDIIIFLIVITILIFSLIAFIISILYLYRKRQLRFEESLHQLKLDHEKMILSTKLEIQEETFKHISREIHDNINLSLTLAKLNLHTIDSNKGEDAVEKVNNSIELITQSISELSDISKSLNADIIIHHGLLKAIEEEIERIKRTGVFKICYRLTGNPVYMEAQKELIIFRIVQEAFNNIIKHAEATNAGLSLNYGESTLQISINDNGNGFDQSMLLNNQEAGLRNMENRTKVLNGSMSILSVPGQGTLISFTVPFE